MDQYNVLSFTTNLDELEQDMNNWNMLTYDEKKVANDYAMQRYNMTNENLYNYMKASILDHNPINNDPVTEASMINELNKWRYYSTVRSLNEVEISVEDEEHLPPKGYTKSGMVNDRYEIIKTANLAVLDDKGDIVVINDFLDDYHMDYTLDQLEAMFNKYNLLAYDHKMESDSLSVALWGKDVPSMYHIMKAKILNMINPVDHKSPEIDISSDDRELNSFKLDLVKAQKDNDIVAALRKKAQYLSNRKDRSLYENAVLEGFFDKITVNGKSYRQGMPEVTPFLTYDEYVNNPKCLDEKRINFVDPFTYIMNFKDKEHKMKEEIEEAYINKDTDKLLSLGWNPIVKPTAENFRYARERQIQWMDEHCGINIYNMSNMDTEIPVEELDTAVQEAVMHGKDLAPVYMVVSQGMLELDRRKNTTKGLTYYNDIWRCPGIAFEPKLDNIYYYSATDDTDLHVMEKENLKRYSGWVRNSDIAVMVFFVPSEVRSRLMKAVNHFYIYQTSSKHSFDNFYDLVKDNPRVYSNNIEFACGQFMNSIFTIAQIDYKNICTITSEKVTETTDKKSNMIMLFKGKAINYSEAKVRNNTNALLAFNDYMDLTFFKKGLDLHKLHNNLRIKMIEEAYIPSEDPEVEEVLKEMRSIFKATNFLEGANTSLDINDIASKVSDINLKLSECSHTEVGKIQHFINEIYNIKSMLSSRPNLDTIGLSRDIDYICDQYRTITEGGKYNESFYR